MSPFISRIARRTALLSALVLASACSTDAVSGPRIEVSQNENLIGALTKPVFGLLRKVTVGKLNTTFLVAQTQSAVIGPKGGKLVLPSTGFELIVPPGAVDSMTTFSVTLNPGSAMAYEFEPHGAKFNKPLRFRQNTSFGDLSRRTIFFGGYFAHESQVHDTFAFVSELLPAVSIGGWIEFKIWHFSGYLVSCA